METVTYYLALVSVMGVPAGLTAWFVLHLFATRWCGVGPVAVRGATAVTVLAVMGVVFLMRGPVLRLHFGVSAPLVAAAIILFGLSSYLRVQILRELPMRVVLDLPGIRGRDAGELITTGIYSRMRHPGYAAMSLMVAASALFTNYLAMYVVALGYVALISLAAVLEERELAVRFPGAYAAYCARVPRFVPRFSV
jgi:protein-S-isoprenylcysteine O-methyltransferase Ste14